jgi:CRP/FNR family transcriptional regulator, cyclic AMP receptor protein
MDEARAGLLARLVELEWVTEKGEWAPTAPPGHLGLLIINGLLLREVQLLGTPSAEVLGQGDLLRPWDIDGDPGLPFGAEIRWTVLSPVTVAALDAAFLRRAARWPEVLAALVGRAVARAKSLALQDTITNLKHVETRLLVEFWHLAERWGRVGAERISLVMPVTHEMLAKLVGATRPSVTTALGRLAERELLLRDAEGVWLLSPDIPRLLESISSQPETTISG